MGPAALVGSYPDTRQLLERSCRASGDHLYVSISIRVWFNPTEGSRRSLFAPSARTTSRTRSWPSARLPLGAREIERLRVIMIAAVESRDRREFRTYTRLAPKLDSPNLREAVLIRLRTGDAGSAVAHCGC